VLAAGVVLNLRRASYVTLAMSLGLIPFLLHGRRRAAIRLAIPALLLCLIYGAVFWDRPGSPLGFPVQKFRSVFAPQAGTTDYSSNLYRVAENINLQTTILDHPAGLGFGHKFELHVPLADISALFEDWQYHPHNTLLGIWAYMGTIGALLFLIYLGSLLIFAAQELRWQGDPYLKAVSYFILTALIASLFIATVDHYLATQRGGLFLGTLAGMLTVLFRLRTGGPDTGRDRAMAGG
ncbi:MAG: O-antigen ligase family protein, partial [Deltaproteobacteria bacterium]|nr:O-antigen ligase family protein [Deltaproteobacteria bacterium]